MKLSHIYANEKSFLQLNEVKEHIKVHTITSEVKDSATISIYGEDCVTADHSIEEVLEKKKAFKCHVCYYNFSSKTNIATIHGGKKSNDEAKKEKAASEQNKKIRKKLEKAERKKESKLRKNTCGFCSKARTTRFRARALPKIKTWYIMLPQFIRERSLSNLI